MSIKYPYYPTTHEHYTGMPVFVQQHDFSGSQLFKDMQDKMKFLEGRMDELRERVILLDKSICMLRTEIRTKLDQTLNKPTDNSVE